MSSFAEAIEKTEIRKIRQACLQLASDNLRYGVDRGASKKTAVELAADYETFVLESKVNDGDSTSE